MNNVKNKLVIILILILMIVGVKVLSFGLAKNENDIIEEIKELGNEDKINNETNVIEEINRYEDNKKINDDYVGYLYFKSGIINQPVVKAKGQLSDYTFYAYTKNNIVTNYETGCEDGPCSLNDIYLRKNWISGEYDIAGTTFMDYRNTLDDQNIIIYGHLYIKSMDEERKLMFSPLESLLNKENYDLNSELYLELEGETRTYKIAYVYLFDKTSNDYNTMQYYRTNYDVDYYGNPDTGYYENYINKMEGVKKYDTGVKLTSSDNTLTLQTCYEADNRFVEIVVAKEIK